MRWILPLLALLPALAQASTEDLIRQIFAAPASEAELDHLMREQFDELSGAVEKNLEQTFTAREWSANAEFIGCDIFPGGVDAIRKLYDEGMNRGLEELHKMVGLRKKDAIAYTAVLLRSGRKPRIACFEGESMMIPSFEGVPTLDENARVLRWRHRYAPRDQDVMGGVAAATSTQPGSPGWPAIFLNIKMYKYKIGENLRTDVPQTLFHEGLHWLGYRDKGFFSTAPDLIWDFSGCVYDAEPGCCGRLKTLTYDANPFLIGR